MYSASRRQHATIYGIKNRGLEEKHFHCAYRIFLSYRFTQGSAVGFGVIELGSHREQTMLGCIKLGRGRIP
jgi:hypothetical protein